MSLPTARCSVAGCEKPVEAAGLCATHRKRRQRMRPLDPPVHRRDAAGFDRVVEAAIALADAEGDEAFELGKDRLRKAAEAWLRARGWTRLAAAEVRDNGRLSRTGT